MTRRRKVIYSIIGAGLLASGLGVWMAHRYDVLLGYEVAGLQPIPGAEIVSMESDGTCMSGTDTWTYKLPAGYVDRLAGHCASIGYREGTYLDEIKAKGFKIDPDPNVKPGMKGCFMSADHNYQIVMAQFAGDKLIVTHSD